MNPVHVMLLLHVDLNPVVVISGVPVTTSVAVNDAISAIATLIVV